jgi:3-oxoadipate CoA-transferase alpha subunit
VDNGSNNLTVICQGEWRGEPADGGDGAGIRSLVANGQVSKLISPLPFHSFDTGNEPSSEPSSEPYRAVEARWKSGQLEIEVIPQGVLAERLRSGGSGIGGVFLPTGTGTRFGAAKEVREFGGRDHLFEPALKADFALLRAVASDTLGNLVYDGTQRGWNTVMAMAARVSVVEVDDVYDAGELDGELVVTPGIFVNRIVRTR